MLQLTVSINKYINSCFFFASAGADLLFSFWTSDSNWIVSSGLAMLWTCLSFHDQLATCSFVLNFFG